MVYDTTHLIYKPIFTTLITYNVSNLKVPSHSCLKSAKRGLLLNVTRQDIPEPRSTSPKEMKSHVRT
ncbi:hypothetical protein TSAR_003898 [Trichomalopsis sarcophagae]|uniref:Uncharacterized protein n=1 Tax=Trichomalopsis sarcophagae TaxID=543379 RepID=A0A232ELR5_9HYME|nr:hypothetical protein TSAR_003898 [Trichomalopsis sarcophagae]